MHAARGRIRRRAETIDGVWHSWGNTFPMQVKTATQEPDMETAMKVVYQWNYAPEIEEL